MKQHLITLVLILAVMTSCQNKVFLSVTNPIDTNRTNEVIVLNKQQITKNLTLADNQLPVFKTAEGDLLTSQLDDMNNDGQWDEAAILIDIKAGETMKVFMEAIDKASYPAFKKTTNARLGIKQEEGIYKEYDNYKAIPADKPFKVIAQAESVSWENDKMAFRNYFDCRNIKDLFGKLSSDLLIHKLSTPEMGSYHKLNTWGMDVLHCGSSLGCGGIAIMKNDSLIRLGSVKDFEYQKITTGAVRSILELRYKGWDVDGENMSATEHIAIYPGKYWFESNVTFSNKPAGAKMVTGLVNSHFKGEPFKADADNFTYFGTHGVQSLNKDELGMAIMIPKAEAGKTGRTTDNNYYQLGYKTVDQKKFSHIISETYYISQEYKANTPARHYLFAAWELENDQWKTQDGFTKYIKDEAHLLSNPLQVVY